VRSFAEIETALDGPASAGALLAAAEEVLEHWVRARGETPTTDERASFNACRETCREIAYHYNLLGAEAEGPGAARRRLMMAMLVKHLALFVGGKLQAAGLGEFCCSSRPLRIESA
jgi:hypothetical protein